MALVLGLAACGGGDGSDSSSGSGNGSGGGSGDDWVIALYEGESATGPGSFRGGEYEISEEVVSQGLDDIESGTVATIVGDTGETFDGNCFMIREEDGRYEQLVMCGPFVAPDGTVRWLKTAFSFRQDGEEVVGFESAPNITAAGGGTRPVPTAEEAKDLVRPDGTEPNTES